MRGTYGWMLALVLGLICLDACTSRLPRNPGSPRARARETHRLSVHRPPSPPPVSSLR